MTNSIRGAASNRPDTSPANVARVLREVLAELDDLNAHAAEQTGEVIDYTPAECEGNALADALDAQADALKGSAHPLLIWAEEPGDPAPLQDTPWQERVERAGRALLGLPTDAPADYGRARYLASHALRAGFPEMAPADD